MTSFSRQKPFKSKNKKQRIFWNTEFYHPAKSELKRIKNAKLVPSLQLFASVLAQRATPVPPKPQSTPSAKKKLRFTPEVSTAELAQELPFSEEPGARPWDTPTLAVKRKLKKKAAEVAKKKGKSLAKKALDWKT